MNTSHDPAKSDANELKHGVPLDLADAIDWLTVWCAPDVRKDYGELREIGYVPIDGQPVLRGIHAARRNVPRHQPEKG